MDMSKRTGPNRQPRNCKKLSTSVCCKLCLRSRTRMNHKQLLAFFLFHKYDKSFSYLKLSTCKKISLIFLISVSDVFSCPFQNEFSTRHRRGVSLSDVFLFGVNFAHLSLRFLLLLQPRLSKTVKRGMKWTNPNIQGLKWIEIDSNSIGQTLCLSVTRLNFGIDLQAFSIFTAFGPPCVCRYLHLDCYWLGQFAMPQHHLELLLHTKNFWLLAYATLVDGQ